MWYNMGSLTVGLLFSCLLSAVQAGTPGQLNCVIPNKNSSACNSGHNYDSVVQRAIQGFDRGLYYGGNGEQTVYSAANVGSVVVQVFYQCNPNVTTGTPRLAGTELQAMAQKIAACPGQCGSAYSTADCGVGILMFTDYRSTPQNRQYADHTPNGTCCTSVPTTQKLLSDLADLTAQVQDLETAAENWLDAAAQASSPNDTSASAAASIQSSILNSYLPRIDMYAVSVQQEFNEAAQHGNQVASNQLPNVQSLITSIRNLRTAAAGAGAINVVAISQVIRAQRNSILAVFTVLAGLISTLRSSGGGNGGTTTQPTTSVTKTTTSTSTTSTSSICDPCSAINAAVAQATVLARSLPTEAFPGDDLYLASGISDLEDRSLEKRSSRVYTSKSIGSYGQIYHLTQPPMDFCPNNLFTWHAGAYPSTAGSRPSADRDDGSDDPNDTVRSSAPDLPNIGTIGGGPFANTKYEYHSYHGDPNAPLVVNICGATIGGFTDRRGAAGQFIWSIATGKSQAPPYQYDTEHVFELHIIKDWFYWLKTQQNLNLDCRALQRIFGGGDDSAANSIMKQLAYYDGTNGPLDELFVLERTLNQLKGAFMHGRPLTENESQFKVIPRPRNNDWLGCLSLLQDAKVMFDYLSNPGPRNAFIAARDGVRGFLGNSTAFLEINDNPPGRSWVSLWDEFIDAWLNKRQTDATNWRLEMKQICLATTGARANPCWTENNGALFDFTYPLYYYDYPNDW